MDVSNLEEGIQSDLETLKTLRVGIIPAKTFYEGVFFRTLWVFVLFVVLQLFACFIALNIGGWTTAPESFTEHFETFTEQQDQMSGLVGDMKARLNQRNALSTESETQDAQWTQKAVQLQKKQAHEAKLKEIREDDHLARVIKMFAGVIFSSFFFTLFFIGKIKNWVIFKYQFQNHLQTGGYIAKKIQQAFTIYFGIFGVVAVISFNFFEQAWAICAGVPAFLVAGIATVILMEMELSRLGVSTLIRLLTQLFREGDKPT